MTAKSRRSVKRLCTKMSGKRSKRKQAVKTGSDIQHAALAHLDFDAFHLQSHRAHGERQIRPLEAKTDSQARYMRAIQTHPVTFGIGPANGELYTRLESGKGEIGVFIQGNNDVTPWRFKIRAADLNNLQILPHILKGAKIADIMAILGSIDVIMGSVDR